jgi:hypothetical protein
VEVSFLDVVDDQTLVVVVPSYQEVVVSNLEVAASQEVVGAFPFLEHQEVEASVILLEMRVEEEELETDWQIQEASLGALGGEEIDRAFGLAGEEIVACS